MKQRTITQKFLKLKKILDHDQSKYITTQGFDKLTAEMFAARLAQANLVTKADIHDFVEKKDFDDKLKNLNKKATSNKTKHVETEKKLTDLRNKVAQIPKKGYDFLLGRIYFIGD